jgi:hypothetical protein
MGKGDGAGRVSQNRFQSPPCGIEMMRAHSPRKGGKLVA